MLTRQKCNKVDERRNWTHLVASMHGRRVLVSHSEVKEQRCPWWKETNDDASMSDELVLFGIEELSEFRKIAVFDRVRYKFAWRYVFFRVVFKGIHSKWISFTLTGH